MDNAEQCTLSWRSGFVAVAVNGRCRELMALGEVAEVDRLVSHRPERVRGHRGVLGLRGQLDGRGEQALGDAVLRVVKSHPACDVGQFGGGREHLPPERVARERAVQQPVHVIREVLHRGGSRVPAAVPLVHPREERHGLTHRFDVAASDRADAVCGALGRSASHFRPPGIAG